MKTIGKLLGNEGMSAATVVSLSGILVVLMCKADGPVRIKKMVARVLSNPVRKLGTPWSSPESPVKAATRTFTLRRYAS